jgi:hypothetical protein
LGDGRDLRGGITCVKCNRSLGSLKFFQPVNEQYRCPSCGFIGKIFAGQDKLLYLVGDEGEIPLATAKMAESKNSTVANIKKAVKPVERRDNKRERTISSIIHLVDLMNIQEFSGWDDIDFRNIKQLGEQKGYLTEELAILQENLERVYEKRMAATVVKEKTQPLNHTTENVSMNVPEILKKSFDDWYRVSIGMIELYAKDLVKSARGRDKNELKAFLEFVSTMPKEKKANVFWNMEEEEDDEELNSAEAETISFLEDKTDEDLVEDDFDESILEKWQQLAPEMVRESVFGWKTLSLSEMQQEVLDLIGVTKSRASRTELEDYLGILDDMLLYDDDEMIEELDDDVTYDPLAVIEKYKHGAIEEDQKSTAYQLDESWRKLVPATLKHQIKDWKTAPIQSVYDQAKEIMGQSIGSARRQELMLFVVELSQIIFDSKDDEEEEIEAEDDSVSRDAASEAVMSLVEMIILPHLEVMDIIQSRGGKITFSNLWYKPFTDKLKEEVKDRDEWKCVICEAETDLHVHHKIPREKGGIHHKANLVTLCASCHAAVETADIQHAFKKCLANYNRKKFSHINRETLSMDKKLLREEVEYKLDALLHELNKRDEHTLMQEVVGVMKRLEIIFYD